MAKDLAYRDTFARNLARRIRESGKTQVEVANETGISPSAMSSYVQGVRYPRPEYVTTLANYFGVTPGELTEDGDMKTSRIGKLSNEAIRIGETFDQLDALGQEVVRFVVDAEYQRTKPRG